MQRTREPAPDVDRPPWQAPTADALLQQAVARFSSVAALRVDDVVTDARIERLPEQRAVARLLQLASIDLRKYADALDRAGDPHDYCW